MCIFLCGKENVSCRLYLKERAIPLWRCCRGRSTTMIMGRYRNAAAYGGSVRVVNAPPMIERMMKLAGMGRLDVFK